MTTITITICLSIAALVAAIIFVPGVASAIMTGLSLGMFRAIGENRAKRIKERRENGGGGLLGLRKRRAPHTPQDTPQDKLVDPVEADKWVRRLQRWRGRHEG